MKKLFLYTAVLIFLFWSGFLITRELYRNKEYRYEIVTTEHDKEYSKTAFPVHSVISSDTRLIIKSMVGLLSVLDLSGKGEDTQEYMVGIKDGYVIVFDGSEEVFEYTGIEAELIQTLNHNLYERLKSGMHFESIEDIYLFLESISS